MKNTRLATDQEIEVLNFLNNLRESGVTNMYGATPYIQDAFELNRTAATQLLKLWMANFNKESNYKTIKN